MSNLLQLTPVSCALPQGETRLVTLAATPDGHLYIAEEPTVSLHIAVSCLVQPAAGDRVRVIADGNAYWVLDLLLCADPGRALAIQTAHDSLHIDASTLTLRAQQTMTLEAPALSLISRTGNWIAERLNQIAEKVQVRCKSSERLVSEIESIEAGHISHTAKTSYRIDGELTSLNGRTVLKIDGGQVHVG